MYRHPAFKGLSEKELISIYNIAKVRKIKTGSLLFKEEDTNPTLFLILEGSVQLLTSLEGHIKKTTIFRCGDWLSPTSYTMKGANTASALVKEALTVIVLENGGLNTLPLKLQFVIFKNMSDLAAQRIHDLSIKQIELSAKQAKLEMNNRYLASRMADLIKLRSDEYAGSEIIQNILNKIPRLPMYTSKLAMLLFEKNVSSREVSNMAGSDPSLVGAILKTVNSAYYGLQGKVSDFQHALMLLGFNQVYQLAVDTGIRSTMPNTPEFQELQFHSMMVSLISFEIARLCNMKRPVSDSTIGLLHDIGKSVALLLKNQNPKVTLLIDLLDHPKLGSLLLKKWNIPETVYQPLAYQDYPKVFLPEQIPSEYRKNVAILYIAHLCSECIQGKRNYELTTPFTNDYMNLLGISEKTISNFVRQKVLPCLSKQLNNFPQAIRHFLAESVSNFVDKDLMLDVLDR